MNMPRRKRSSVISSNLGAITVIVQGFAVFVALSVFLGRIYFVTYYDALGIPSSDININLLAYTVISPNVTLLGIALAILSVSAYFSGPIRRHSTELTKPVRSIAGLLIGFGFTIPILASLIYDFAPQYESVAFGFMLLIGIVSTVSGYAILGNENPPSTSTQPNPFRAFLKRPLMAISLILLISVVISSMAAGMIGDREAYNLLNNAPTAKIEMITSFKTKDSKNNSICSESEHDDCVVRVIHVGEAFTYLVPADTDPGSADRVVIAIPTREINRITYSSFRDREW